MRKPGRKHKPPSTLAAPNQVNQSSSWPLVSHIVKAMVASGVLLFICNLGYDAAKATILRRLQLEEENKQLKTRLEMIEHKILPKVEQAEQDVKMIQAPLDLHEKLTPAQMDKLALKARDVHSALEEIGYFVKLNSRAMIEPPQENHYADLSPGPVKLDSTARVPITAKRPNSTSFTNLPQVLHPPVAHSNADALNDSINPAGTLTVIDFVREEPASAATPDSTTTNFLDALKNDRFANLVAPLAGAKKPAVARNLEFEGLPPLPTRRYPNEIMAVVARHKAALQDCYKQALKLYPNLKGEIKVRFTVSTPGNVIAASLLSSTTNNAQLDQLILEKIRRWSDFGEVSPELGNQTFRQTFIFIDENQGWQPALASRNLAAPLVSR